MPSPTSSDRKVPKTWIDFKHVPISDPILMAREIRYFGHLSLSHSLTVMAGEVLVVQPFRNNMVVWKGSFWVLGGPKQQVSTKMI